MDTAKLTYLSRHLENDVRRKNYTPAKKALKPRYLSDVLVTIDMLCTKQAPEGMRYIEHPAEEAKIQVRLHCKK